MQSFETILEYNEYIKSKVCNIAYIKSTGQVFINGRQINTVEEMSYIYISTNVNILYGNSRNFFTKKGLNIQYNFNTYIAIVEVPTSMIVSIINSMPLTVRKHVIKIIFSENINEFPISFRDFKSLTEINIPNIITSISNKMFYNCKNLKTINLPNTITTIGTNAFRNCYRLVNINIPSSVEYIGNQAFWHCKSLKSIVIPNSVQTIGTNCFGCCYKLTTIKINSNIMTIPTSCFSNCNSLETVVWQPNSMYAEIDNNAFNKCESLKNIDSWANNISHVGLNAFYKSSYHDTYMDYFRSDCKIDGFFNDGINEEE